MGAPETYRVGMSNGYDSVEDVASKVDWEGGVTETILGYGLGSENLPADTPQDVVEAWKVIEGVGEYVSTVQNWLDTADFSRRAEDQ